MITTIAFQRHTDRAIWELANSRYRINIAFGDKYHPRDAAATLPNAVPTWLVQR